MNPSIRLLALACCAAAAGCALPNQGGQALRDSPVHGLVSLQVNPTEVDADFAVDGFAGSTDGSEWEGGGSVLVDLLWPRWMLSFESGSTVLGDDFDLVNGGSVFRDAVAVYERDELLVGFTLLTAERLDPSAAADAPRPPARIRLDALAGGRLNTLTVDDIEVGGFDVDEEREHWGDAIAGLRAEWRISDWFTLRGRGDAAFAGDSDDAWSLRVSLVYGPSPGWAIGAGWEARAVDFESGAGPSLDGLDARFSGPFVAFELLF